MSGRGDGPRLSPRMDAVASLVLRARSGDAVAFSDLYARYGRGVFLYLVGLLRLREDAEDALQATFLSAWRHLGSLRDDDRFPPWLFRIARNAARDAMRRRSAWPQALGDGEDLLGASPPPREGEHGDVRECLAGLRPKTRALVLLRAVNGWTAEEVGAAFSWSAATVRRRYARALALLEARLSGVKR
jgi:RNA polymerase sigma-70 factor, ECF subfamily